MARLIASNKANTVTSTANGANLVDSTYPVALQGGVAAQRTNVNEVYIGGQSGASSIQIMCLGRDTQVATGAMTKDATLNVASIDASALEVSATPAVVFNLAATNKPQRSTTANLLCLSLNLFGGIVRWVAAPGFEISMVGVTQPLGELSLSAFTGGTAGGVLGAHVMFETF